MRKDKQVQTVAVVTSDLPQTTWQRQRHNARNPELNKLRKRAAQMLVAGNKCCVICDRLGISRVTLWRWRKNQTFQLLCRELELEVSTAAYYLKSSVRHEMVARMIALAHGNNLQVAYRATAFLLRQ